MTDAVLVSITIVPDEVRGDELRARIASARATAHHSVSHTRGMSAIACSEARVGIDLEAVRPRVMLDRLARRSMTDAELASFAAGPVGDRDERFAQHWTRVEAYLKAIGEGVRAGLRTRPPTGWSVLDLDLLAPHVGAIAVEATEVVVSVDRLSGAFTEHPGTSG